MRKITIISFLIIYAFIASGQDDLETVKKEIVTEGNFLYDYIQKTDLALTTYKNNFNPDFSIGSLMYITGDYKIIIVFPAHADSTSVYETYDYQNDSIIKSELAYRKKTAYEKMLTDIYGNSMASAVLYQQMAGLRDIAFWIVIKKNYNGFTTYILTRSLKDNILPIGNDFINTYNEKGKWQTFRNIHNNYIPIPTKYASNSDAPTETYHTHSNRNSDFITSTDLCILRLYSKNVGFKRHLVASRKYISEYNFETNELSIMTREEFKHKEGIEKLKF